ncbi:Mu transposase C-terminal domain-containing protein [Ruegeria profundi]|uniref:Integrase catalytic domain-containing protein n=1 Tax=Ruegeria profundi TaxID=1685378 RepID=A0A0X3TPS1_9RHOB|nr:Mu transposase C-terminal domain-containing protein [Ruegeria profundi]KUJ77748.1 hypothetical protein AVO44_15565 [Ruegeria profundi]
MNLVSRKDGRTITHNGEDYVVDGPVPSKDAVQLIDQNGEVYQISGDEFRKAISNGLVRSSELSPTRYGTYQSEEHRLETDFRLFIVRQELRLREKEVPRRSRRVYIEKQVSQKAQFAARRKPFPSQSTINDWTSKFIKNGVQGLVPKTHRSGNRTDRCDAVFREIVENLIEQQYLPHDRLRVSDLHREACRQYLFWCSENDLEAGNCGRKVVEAIIKTLPHDDLIKRKMGSKHAKTHRKQAKKFYDIEAPFDRVEIDSTPADIMVTNRSGELVGRPWVTAAIDCATGWVLAQLFTLHHPNSETIVETLMKTMTHCEEEFFENFGIVSRKTYAAKPKLFVLDQAQENQGDFLDAVIIATRSEVFWAEPRNPQQKPFIERYNRTFNDMVKTLPGATESTLLPGNSRQEKAEEEACLTLDEFEEIMQKWRFDEYHLRQRKRICSVFRKYESPLEAMQRLAEEHVMPDPLTLEERAECFWVFEETRGGWKYGVEFEHMQFWSEELGDLLRRIGYGKQLKIRYNPLDVRMILVVDPQDERLVPAYNKIDGLDGLSYAAIKAIRPPRAKMTPDCFDSEAVLQAMMERRQTKKLGKTKMQKTRADEIERRRTHRMHERALKQPLIPGQVLVAPRTSAMTIPTTLDLPKVEKKNA